MWVCRGGGGDVWVCGGIKRGGGGGGIDVWVCRGDGTGGETERRVCVSGGGGDVWVCRRY